MICLKKKKRVFFSKFSNICIFIYVYTTTNKTEKRLKSFENRIWREIYGPIFDNRTAAWELQEKVGLAVNSFISGQRIKFFGHVICRNEEDTLRVVLEWKPTRKRPHGRPRKKCLDKKEYP